MFLCLSVVCVIFGCVKPLFRDFVEFLCGLPLSRGVPSTGRSTRQRACLSCSPAQSNNTKRTVFSLFGRTHLHVCARSVSMLPVKQTLAESPSKTRTYLGKARDLFRCQFIENVLRYNLQANHSTTYAIVRKRIVLHLFAHVAGHIAPRYGFHFFSDALRSRAHFVRF